MNPLALESSIQLFLYRSISLSLYHNSPLALLPFSPIPHLLTNPWECLPLASRHYYKSAELRIRFGSEGELKIGPTVRLDLDSGSGSVLDLGLD